MLSEQPCVFCMAMCQKSLSVKKQQLYVYIHYISMIVAVSENKSYIFLQIIWYHYSVASHSDLNCRTLIHFTSHKYIHESQCSARHCCCSKSASCNVKHCVSDCKISNLSVYTDTLSAKKC